MSSVRALASVQAPSVQHAFRQPPLVIPVCGPKLTISAPRTSTEAKTSTAQRLKQMFPFPLPLHTEIRPPTDPPTTRLVVIQLFFATILSL